VTARIYLDWNATAPLRPEARAAVVEAFDCVGNASSVHAEGRRARAIVESAREDVARLVGADQAMVVFTSGATESNAHVLRGPWDTVVSADIEHDSVTANIAASRARRIELPVDDDGIVEIGDVMEDIASKRELLGRALITLQMANSETGILQPVGEVAALARDNGLAIHTDAVQAIGRMPVRFADLGVDYLSLSAHKLGGPKGIGALVVRDGAPLSSLIAGGGQERRRRAGTENVAAIAGFGAAARAAARDLSTSVVHQTALRDRLEAGIARATTGASIIGEGTRRLPNTSCIALAGQAAETLVIKFDLAGIAISAGSACSSGKVGSSPVLRAMGVRPDIARAAIRVSVGPSTTETEVDAFIDAWARLTNNVAAAA
jgi:cysteine desulfurase